MYKKLQAVSWVLLVWLLAGPAHAQGVCPDAGDVAPGTLDDSTVPPTWNIEPDGAIGIGDVVALLRTAVGLQQLAPAPLDFYLVIPGITSGAPFSVRTERDCPTALTLPLSVIVDTTDDPPGGPLSDFVLERYDVSFRNITRGGADVPGVDVPLPNRVTVAGVLGAGGVFPATYDIAAGPILPLSAKSLPPLNDDAFYLVGTDPITGVVLEAEIVWVGHPVGQPTLEFRGTMIFRFTVYDLPDGSPEEMTVCDIKTDC